MIKENFVKLKERINSILSEIGHLDSVKKEIGREFVTRNISANRAMNLFVGIEQIDTIGESENNIRFLFLFTLALNKAVKDIGMSVDVKDYFTELEYKQWKEYKEEGEADSVYPLVFENVQQIADRIWQTTITVKQLAKLDANNLILYNFKTQRNPKITVGGVKIDFDKTKANEIKNNLLNSTQYPDHIKLNILNNFHEKIHYNNKTQTLVIGEGSIVNIFDGYHRKVSSSLAIEENPDLDFTWGLIFTNLSEEAARDYMVQIDKQKPIKREQIKSWDFDKKENQVVSVIADDRISKLAKVMKDQESEVKLRKGLTTKNIVATAIRENYELTDATDIREIGKWIVEFTDYLFSLYPEVFIASINKEINYMNHKNIFLGCIAMSANLRYSDKWKELTKETIQSVDFNKDNRIWKDMGLIGNRDVNKTSRKKIYNLFTGRR